MTDILYQYEDNEIKNYADDTTLYSSATDIPTVNSEFQVTSTKRFNWLDNNHMRSPLGKLTYYLVLKLVRWYLLPERQ